MVAGQDAEAQAHVAAAGGKEVEEERLLQVHAGVEQDDEVSCGGGEDRGEGVGRRATLGRGTASKHDDEDGLLQLGKVGVTTKTSPGVGARRRGQGTLHPHAQELSPFANLATCI